MRRTRCLATDGLPGHSAGVKPLVSPSTLAGWLAAVVTACAAASGSVSDPSAAPAQQLPPQAGPAAEPDVAGPEPALPVELPAFVADTTPRTARTPSIRPFGLIWTPASPREGSAFALRVLQPVAGRDPKTVEGRFAELPVRFARLDGEWFAIVAVPIGTVGEQDLTVRFAFDEGPSREQSTPIHVASREWSQSRLDVAPRFTSPSQQALERINRERATIRAVLDAASPEWLLDGPFRPPRPLDITSPFGQERMFNGEVQSRHTGLDLRGQQGEPAYAAARGRVALTGDFYFSGNGIFLDHGLGVYTGYFHLSEILVSDGQIVEPGQLIGRVGATGRVTAPHLHWSLWVAGSSLDAGSLLEMSTP